ncbi:MAG: AAA family ATPase [Nocardioidaceae bacterium]|nr:AAA family ATPase [Nocardioidaceae bacterium]
MGQLPTGTVTLLFSDIEGSTLLLNRLGPHWGDALSAQRSILRSCFAANDGHEMGTEGDSFFVVFASAHAAAAAALEGQRRLQAHTWPSGVPVRVRMGLHTGEPQRHEDGYIGIDVHRAARIAATASGGQIVISETTKVMLSNLEHEVVVRDLGWHRLKDLAEAEHLFEVVANTAGALPEFPPLRSLGTRANLPTPNTPLIGRERELAELRSLFEREGTRLVTMTGPGGTGKTRLALDVAATLEHLFPHGIFFVQLHTADRAPLMWAGIAESIGANGDVEEHPEERVLRWLADRQALLVLDNLEQIDGADDVIGQVLAQAPHVSVLATSRRGLHLVAEQEYPVAPLALPARSEQTRRVVEQSGAVELFVQRATMARLSFALTDTNTVDVVELCRRLDGLPLAIELAAAQSRVLSPHAMLTRIDERLGLGVTAADRAPRQRSLGATIAWSYDLLDSSDQQVFRRLGVFSSSCDLAAIDAVVGSEVEDSFHNVVRLVDANLVQIVESPDGEPSMSMLQTIRSFARERLEASGEAEETRWRHARWCLSVVVTIDELLKGSMQMSALDRMAAVEEDIRFALAWSLRPASEVGQERTECGLNLLAAMTAYWYRFGYLAEGRGWYERAIAVAGTEDSASVIDVLHGMGIMMLQQSDVSPATQVFGKALKMARRLDDRDRESRESNSLGIAYRVAGNLPEARRLIERSLVLAREVGSAVREATALGNIVMLLVDFGEYETALTAADEAIAADSAREDPWGIAITQANVAMALLRAEGPQRAYEHLADIGPAAVALADAELSITIVELFAATLAELGDATRAAHLLGTADVRREVVGMPRQVRDAEELDLSIGRAKQELTTQEWEAAYADGRRLTIDEVVREALAVRLLPQ